MFGSAKKTIRRAVILTALELEHASVLEHLSRPTTERTERGLIFEIGTFRGVQPWEVAVALVGVGNVSAAVVLERAVASLAPEVAIFVGIAGGRRDVVHGDVVAADAVYDYETGKDAGQEYSPWIRTVAPSFALVQRAQAVARHGRWQDRIHGAPRQRPNAFVRPIAAGSKVVAHGRSATGALLASHCGDAFAIDMESYGFLHGAYHNQDVATLVVRGISDLLSDKTEENDRERQMPAARHAAAFAFEVLATLVLPDGAPHEHAAQAPAPEVPQQTSGAQYHMINTPSGGGVVYANQHGDQNINVGSRHGA